MEKETSKDKTVIIIGAGPAGLAAAYQLLKVPGIKPILIEQDSQVGGISKTIEHNGYRIDIGPHRFFSKVDRVNDFWQEILGPKDGESGEGDFLSVNRLTRIFFLKKFFNYPIKLNYQTLSNLGPWRVFKIGLSYIRIRLFPIRSEKSLADFYINRFGQELYETFFMDYTEKVWGVPCEKIPPSWGGQRVKGLSVTEVIKHAIFDIFKKKGKKVETSLIEKFHYPRYGAGQMYQETANLIEKRGGVIKLNQRVAGLDISADGKLGSATIQDLKSGASYEIMADHIISTMPVKELIASLRGPVPAAVKDVAAGLVYRDYIMVGLLFKKMVFNKDYQILPDNWIYIQERDATIGRLDIFNNFSPDMLKDKDNVWLGGEYFCFEGDEFWNKSDEAIKDFAARELERMKMVDKTDLIDHVVLRVKKTYPAYFGSYDRFGEIRSYLDKFENLYLVGRNGMHKYNNMDHSILSGFVAADNIIADVKTKDNLWDINTEEEYHETKKENK